MSKTFFTFSLICKLSFRGVCFLMCYIYFIFSSYMTYYFTTTSRPHFWATVPSGQLIKLFHSLKYFFEGLFLRSWWRWEWGTKVSSSSLLFQLFSVNVSKVEHDFIKCKKSLIISSSVVQNPWNCVVGFLMILN